MEENNSPSNIDNIKYYATFMRLSSYLIIPPIVGVIAKEILIKREIIRDTNTNLLLILGVSFIFSMFGVILEARKFMNKL